MSLFLRCLFVNCLFICAWILAAQSLHALCVCLWATCTLRRVYCTPPGNSSPLAVSLNLVLFTVQRSSSHLRVSCLLQDWKGKKWFRASGLSVATRTSFHAFITYLFAYAMPCDDGDLVWLIYFYLHINKCMCEGQRSILDTFLDHTSPCCFESGSLTEPLVFASPVLGFTAVPVSFSDVDSGRSNSGPHASVEYITAWVISWHFSDT